jgi:hypothetical protein
VFLMELSDKLQALRWSSKYREDYDRYDAYRIEHGIGDRSVIDGLPAPIFKVSMEGQKLCAKYGIPYPFSPYEDNRLPGLSRGLTTAVFPRPMEMGNDRKADVFISGTSISFALTIDTKQSLTKILKEFKELYLYKMRFAFGKKPPRKPYYDTHFTADPWEVYREVQNGKSEWEVAKSMFGLKKRPADDGMSNSRYQQVKRAYSRAVELIAEFEG